MLPFQLVYHPRYDLNLGEHVFPARKYRLIHERLLEDRFAEPADFVEPSLASDADVLRVHEPGWVHRLKTGTLTGAEIVKLEIPYSREMVEGFWLGTGGTILAARNALRDRIGFNIGGGFHHAFPAHGEGFCAIHDVAIAIRVLQHERAIEKALIVDCDVHHGNGTAAIFARDRSVLTLSLHQFNNYPAVKPPSTIDVNLPDGVEDDEYLDRLRGALKVAMSFAPDLLLYVAGADPYREDQLGGLALTMAGLERRDRLVFETALAQSVPVAVVLAGGYARDTKDTVTIHCNTAKAAAAALMQESRQPWMITAKALDIHVEQLFSLLERLHSALESAGIEYRVIGGMAVFFQVSARDHDAARVTRDVDIAVERSDLDRISRAAETFGFRHRHVAGIDMLVNAESPKAKSAVHLVFVREKVRPGDLSAIPGFSEPTKTIEGFLLAPVPDLVRMKLTSFRLKDKTHIIDMDSVGLITPEIEAALPDAMRERLQQVRAEERGA